MVRLVARQLDGSGGVNEAKCRCQQLSTNPLPHLWQRNYTAYGHTLTATLKRASARLRIACSCHPASAALQRTSWK